MKGPEGYLASLRVPVLPVRARQRAGRLLAAGASFEETLADLQEGGAKRVTLEAVQEFFRGNLGLQRTRLERRRQAVEDLKRALARPGSPYHGLAEAALETGLAELLRPSDSTDAGGRNRELRQQTLYLKSQRASLAHRVAETELQVEAARWELARLKLAQLQKQLEQQTRSQGSDAASATLGEIRDLIGGPAAHPLRVAAAGGDQGRELEDKPRGAGQEAGEEGGIQDSKCEIQE